MRCIVSAACLQLIVGLATHKVQQLYFCWVNVAVGMLLDESHNETLTDERSMALWCWTSLFLILLERRFQLLHETYLNVRPRKYTAKVL